MAQLIPTKPDSPNYTMSVTLDGRDYLFVFRLSERESCFYLDLYLTDGTPLCMGRKIVCAWSIWRSFRHDPRIPQGALIAVPVSGGSDAPPTILADGAGELGDGRRVQLLYFPASELAA